MGRDGQHPADPAVAINHEFTPRWDSAGTAARISATPVQKRSSMALGLPRNQLPETVQPALPDRVAAKKTQRDKDWPMVRRLLEAHYFQNRQTAIAAQVRFWLRELRTPELIQECAARWPSIWRAQARRRALLRHARPGAEQQLEAALLVEERAERQADSRYWAPLKAELEQLRHDRLKQQRGSGRRVGRQGARRR